MIATRIDKLILMRLRDEEKNITGRGIYEEKKNATRRRRRKSQKGYVH